MDMVLSYIELAKKLTHFFKRTFGQPNIITTDTYYNLSYIIKEPSTCKTKSK